MILFIKFDFDHFAQRGYESRTVGGLKSRAICVFIEHDIEQFFSFTRNGL